MLISHDRHFLYIHIPKTAGTSITNCLLPHADRPERLWENRLLERIGIKVNHWGPYRRKRFRSHCSIADVQRRLPAPVFARMFKFAFVRNPWDLLVSLYSFVPTRPNHRHAQRVAHMSFAEFVDEWTRRREIFQKPRLCDRRGKLLVDFVGYFENLQDDFAYVCDTIGVKCALQHANRSSHADYRQSYDDPLRALVEERLAEDIEFFGYQFDGSIRRHGSSEYAAAA